jgi:hypothetical protein
MILEKHTVVRIGRVQEGKVMVMRSNLLWCSDGLEFTCWNGEVVRLAFIIDAFDLEIISWAAECRDIRLRHSRHDVGGRRIALRRNQRPACNRTSV